MRWLVGFCPSPNTGLWRLLAGRGPLSHCFAFRYDPANRAWFLVEHSVQGLHVAVLAAEEAGGLITLCRDHGALLEVSSKRYRQYWPVSPFTCVTAVKQLIGLRAPLAWTPRQLYGALLERGARLSFSPSWEARHEHLLGPEVQGRSFGRAGPQGAGGQGRPGSADAGRAG